MRKVSISLAAILPSLMPHTISDCPLRQSPAANTPRAEVAYLPCFMSVRMLERESFSSERDLTSSSSGPRNPIERRIISAGKNLCEPSIFFIWKRPLASLDHSTCTAFSPLTLPFPSETNSSESMQNWRGSRPYLASTSA
eukprot:Lithocolla_globosa_v1_NODE_1384_length_2617_cov_4.443794.p4 type:complete len:140 gc:universal NODE_1384_length_2617_cov_4.443794:52-471(+)